MVEGECGRKVQLYYSTEKVQESARKKAAFQLGLAGKIREDAGGKN